MDNRKCAILDGRAILHEDSRFERTDGERRRTAYKLEVLMENSSEKNPVREEACYLV